MILCIFNRSLDYARDDEIGYRDDGINASDEGDELEMTR